MLAADEPLDRWLRQSQAIFAREIGSRYAGDFVGYAWAYVTPLAWIGVIYVSFKFLGRTSPIDAGLVSFILSGIMPYLGFRYSVSSNIRARSAYRQVLLLPHIRPETVHASVSALEFYNALLLYAGLLALNAVAGGGFEVTDPLRAIYGFVLACVSGSMLGYAISVLEPAGGVVSRAINIVLRPLFYVSAIFYTANEVPPEWREWLLWNPLLHAIEISRSGLFEGYESEVGASPVPIVFILICLLVGQVGRALAATDPTDRPSSDLDVAL